MEELTTWEDLEELLDCVELTPTDVLFIVAKHCSDNVIDRLDGDKSISAKQWFSRFNILNNYIVNRAMKDTEIAKHKSLDEGE